MLTEPEEIESKILETIENCDFDKLRNDIVSTRNNDEKMLDHFINVSSAFDELPHTITPRISKLQRLIDGEIEVGKKLSQRKSTNEDALKQEVDQLEGQLKQIRTRLAEKTDILESRKKIYEEAKLERQRVLDKRNKNEHEQRLLCELLRAMPVDIYKLRDLDIPSDEAWSKIERISYLLDYPVKPIEEQFPEIRQWRIEH